MPSGAAVSEDDAVIAHNYRNWLFVFELRLKIGHATGLEVDLGANQHGIYCILRIVIWFGALHQAQIPSTLYEESMGQYCACGLLPGLHW